MPTGEEVHVPEVAIPMRHEMNVSSCLLNQMNTVFQEPLSRVRPQSG